MTFVDRELTCADCGATFVFSAGEQLFFSGKGFMHDPKRCKQCKAKRTGGETRRGKGYWHVNCVECGTETTVPFKPTQQRPVYCAECFKRAKAIPIRQSG